MVLGALSGGEVVVLLTAAQQLVDLGSLPGSGDDELVAYGQRDPMRARGCYMPPRHGCTLNDTEVQSSRRNLNLVYTQVNENTFLIQTLRPIRRRDKYAQQTRRGDAGWLPL